MFANTLTVTISGSAKTLTRVNQDNYGSVYTFKDSVELISLKFRHSVDTVKGVAVNRHNMTMERTIFATPTAVEKYYSVTATLRERFDSDPAVLLATHVGFNTLLLAQDDGLVVGEN